MALTKEDKKEVGEIVKANLVLYVEPRLMALEERMERIDFLPTKDEFYTMMDKLFGEMKIMRQENVFWKNRILDHENRLSKAEDALDL